MIVRCENCGARFSLDESRLQPSGVKVKCTKCGEVFDIKDDKAPASPALSDDMDFTFGPEEGDRDARSSAFDQELSKVFGRPLEQALDEKEEAPGEDWVAGLPPEEAQTPSGTKEASEASEGLPLFEVRETTSDDFFDKALPAEDEAEAMPSAAPEAETDEEPAARPTRRGVSKGMVLLAFSLGIVTVLYATGAYGPLLEALTRGNEARPKASFAIEGMKGAFVENDSKGRLFVIEATIRNASSEPRTIAGVAGSLYDAGGAELMTRMVSAGVTLSPEELKTLSEEDIQRHYQDVSAGTVPAMGTIPAMVVFTEIPEGLAEFGLEMVR